MCIRDRIVNCCGLRLEWVNPTGGSTGGETGGTGEAGGETGGNTGTEPGGEGSDPRRRQARAAWCCL